MKVSEILEMSQTAPAVEASVSVDVLLEQTLKPIKKDLELVGARMQSLLTEPVIQRVSYLVSAGGKRLRPALVLLTGISSTNVQRTSLIDAAAALEMIHTATLIHDDIIDQSPLRRQQPTVHARWSTEHAVLIGDYLYASAFTLLAKLEVPALMSIVAEACQQLSLGELREVEARFSLDLTEDEYIKIISDKTASLIGACCGVGAVLAERSDTEISIITRFGRDFGLAFQIIDDCLDLTGDPHQLGKSTYADLDKGALSLPIIYLRQMLSGNERERLFAPLKEIALSGEAKRRTNIQVCDPEFMTSVAEAAKETGAVLRARKRADEFIGSALQALSQIQFDGIQKSYAQLAQYAIDRKR